MRSLEIADRILALLGISGSIVLVALLAYERGAADQRDATPKCKPIVHRVIYDTEELGRMYRARQRLERVK